MVPSHNCSNTPKRGADMKYISEINAFYDWLELNELSTSAVALWYALMHINNKAAWVEIFTVAESVLSVKTGLSGRGVRNARNELKQKGRIDFRSRSGGKAPTYTIISFETGINCFNKSSVTKRVPFSDITECSEEPTEMNSEEKTSTEISSAGSSVDCAGGTSGDTSAGRATLIDRDIDIDNTITTTKESWVIACDYFCKKAGKTNLQLKARELSAARDICKEVPLETVLQGIDQAFIKYKPDTESDRINSFCYCIGPIKGLWKLKQSESNKSNDGQYKANGNSPKKWQPKESTFNNFEQRPDAIETYEKVLESHMNNMSGDSIDESKEESLESELDSKKIMEMIKQKARQNALQGGK